MFSETNDLWWVQISLFSYDMINDMLKDVIFNIYDHYWAMLTICDRILSDFSSVGIAFGARELKHVYFPAFSHHFDIYIYRTVSHPDNM